MLAKQLKSTPCEVMVLPGDRLGSAVKLKKGEELEDKSSELLRHVANTTRRALQCASAQERPIVLNKRY